MGSADWTGRPLPCSSFRLPALTVLTAACGHDDEGVRGGDSTRSVDGKASTHRAAVPGYSTF